MKTHFRILLIYCIFAGDTYSDDKSFNNGRRKEKKIIGRTNDIL